MISIGIAVGFIVPAIGTNYLFGRKSGKLFAIDAGYWIAFYAAMGLVFGLLEAKSWKVSGQKVSDWQFGQRIDRFPVLADFKMELRCAHIAGVANGAEQMSALYFRPARHR